jgi:hypothetical protein
MARDRNRGTVAMVQPTAPVARPYYALAVDHELSFIRH